MGIKKRIQASLRFTNSFFFLIVQPECAVKLSDKMFIYLHLILSNLTFTKESLRLIAVKYLC